jgi:transcriptional regulator with XRE-family HTH domain
VSPRYIFITTIDQVPGGGRPRREARLHEDLARAVVRVLSQARQEAGLSRRALADRSGVSVNTIIKIERADTTDPAFTIVFRLTRALGMDMDDLINHARNIAQESLIQAATQRSDAGVVPHASERNGPESEP